MLTKSQAARQRVRMRWQNTEKREVLMAKEQAIIEIIDALIAAYPRNDVGKKTIPIYVQMLSDLPVEVLAMATKYHITTCKYFPTIAELRQAAADIVCDMREIPDPHEAWNIYLRHRNDTALFDEYHPCGNEFLDRFFSAMGWKKMLTNSLMADRSQFIKAYENYLLRERKEIALTPDIHGFIEEGKTNSEIKQLAERLSVT